MHNNEENNAGPLVLIVDDQPVNIQALIAVLKDDYRIQVATEGKKALEIAGGETRPDLILLDILMPGMNGYEICTHLKSDYRTEGIPVIFITSMDTDTDEENGLSLGAADYITRPYRPGIIRTRIRNQIERIEADKKLLERESYYRSLIHSLHEDIIVIKSNYRISDVNNSTLKTLGLSRKDVIGKHCYKVMHGFDLPCNEKGEECGLKNVMKTGQACNLLHEHQDNKGQRRHIDLLMSPVRDSFGNITHVIEAARDVSELIKAYESLIESEEKHRALVDGLPDIIIRFDQNGAYRFVSENFRKFLGADTDQLIGMTSREIGYPEDYCLFWEESLRKVMESGKLLEREFSHEGKSGSMILNCRLIPELDLEGKIKTILAICRDITCQRGIEKKYEELFREMTDGFAVHEIVADSDNKPVDCRIIAVNPAYERMIGMKADDIVGRTFGEIKFEAEKKWMEIYEKVVLTGEPAFFEKEYQELGKYFEVTVYRPAPGEFACIVEDITERKRSEEEQQRLQMQLVQAQKLESVGRLAGGVAHDFNNMLSVIKIQSELALKKINKDDPIYQRVDMISQAAERSADLTRQLLAFARKQIVSPKVLNLNDTVTGIFNILQRLIGENIDLVWKPGFELWFVKMDPSQVDQMLANLCVNSRDSIEDVGKITVETENVYFDNDYCRLNAGFIPGEYVMLAVGDDGCGMDGEMLSSIFEPFYTTKKVGEGTGLGLPTVYGAVKQNGGFIKVYSEPGHGSIFKIFLPRYVSGNEKIIDHKPEIKETLKGTETILLVEDEQMILKMTEGLLKELGYFVLATDNPMQAVKIAEEYEGRIDLLMTDVVMPEMNGRVLFEKISAVYPDIACLYMSGYTANVIAHHGILKKDVHFLQKPFSVKYLSSRLREALDKR